MRFNTRKSNAFFGEKYPRDRSIREDIFEKFCEKYGEDTIPLLKQEDAMALEIEEEVGGFEVAANKYANQG